MALESPVTYISDLVSTNPTSSDPRNEGDDHIRNIKAAIKATFPNVSGAVLPTHTELNYVDGVTSAIQTQLDAKADLTGDTFTGQVVASYTASYAIDVNGSANGYVGLRAINTNAGSSAYSYLQLGNDTNGAAAALELGSGTNTGFGSIGANGLVLRNGLNAPLGFGTGGVLRMSISAAGNVTINAPSSGDPLRAFWAAGDAVSAGGTSTNVRTDVHLGAPGTGGVVYFYERSTGSAGFAQATSAGAAKTDVLTWDASRLVTASSRIEGNGGGGNGLGKITVSTSDPSGGSQGDIWFKY